VELVTPLLFALTGPLLLATAAAVYLAWRPPEPAGPLVVPVWMQRWRPANWTARHQAQVAIALAAALVVGFGTGWPAAAILAAGAGAAAPALVGGRARRDAAVARIEAIATWTEQLRDVMAAAEGIQGAIIATGAVAPAPIATEVRSLVDRLTIQDQRLRPSLHAFAADLAHPLGDMVVASLLLAAEHQGSPTQMLAEIAASARRTAAMRSEIEASRSQTYVTTRLIVVLTIAMATWLVVGQRQYMAPYGTPFGQLMLLVIGAVFTTSGLRLHQMARPTEPARLLQADPDSEEVTA
jgi:tight adherence protein B